MKEILQRTCVGCRQKKNKKELLRIAKNKNGFISIDESDILQGRGAYICKNINCLDETIKKKKLEKSFSCKIKDDIYENLRGVISGK